MTRSFTNWYSDQVYVNSNFISLPVSMGVSPPQPRSHAISLEDMARAEARAMELLFSCLTTQQRDEYERTKAFTVISNKGNIFKIRRGKQHNIDRYDLQGNHLENWCVCPQGLIPTADTMLAQKMHLEHDEDALMRRANITLVRTGQLIHRAPAQYNPAALADIQLN